MNPLVSSTERPSAHRTTLATITSDAGRPEARCRRAGRLRHRPCRAASDRRPVLTKGPGTGRTSLMDVRREPPSAARSLGSGVVGPDRCGDGEPCVFTVRREQAEGGRSGRAVRVVAGLVQRRRLGESAFALGIDGHPVDPLAGGGRRLADHVAFRVQVEMVLADLLQPQPCGRRPPRARPAPDARSHPPSSELPPDYVR